MMKEEILRSLPLFAALPASEIESLLELMVDRSCQTGEIMIEEGHSSERFYILLEGEVEILKSLGTSDERRMAMRGAGTLLGEMSIFNDQGKHTASVRALTPLCYLEMSRTQFHDLVGRRPEMALGLVSLLSRRLEESENVTIRDLREKNRQLTIAYEDLKTAQAQLIEKERLERELEIASKLQLSILPQAAPRYADYDFGALMVPARMVGGDFYDFIILSPERIGIVVGDVCDKGIPAALFMTLTYTTMRDEALRHPDPGDALRSVNRRLVEINASEMFVTLLYGVLDFSTHEFRYARAGHPRPMVLTPEHPALQKPLRPGQPVGLFDDSPLDEQVIPIPPGSTLLLYSDGLSESLEQRGIRDLGELGTSLLGDGQPTAQELCVRLWQYVDQEAAGIPAQDDFTVLAIRAL